MAEHEELVKEMQANENLSSQKRIELAKKRRAQQLKKWGEAEKKIEKSEKLISKRKSKSSSEPISAAIPYPVRSKRVVFENGVKLLEAAARNDVNEVHELLKIGVSPDVANEDGLTALHQCCIDENEEMLLVLLKFGANVNSRDSELWTPLHAASTCGHLDICRHLVERSADLLAVNADGNMPYDICEDERTLEYLETQMANRGVTQELIDETRLSTEKKMFNELKEYEREGNQLSSWRDRVGASLLHISAANGYFDVVSYLLTKRIDINCTDNDGWTPAIASAFWGQINILELLAKHGADLEVKTKDNKCLIDLVDDVEVKQQIEEIKRAAKSNMDKFKRVNSEIRRRSSGNIRSSVTTPTAMYSSNNSLTDKNPFSDDNTRTPAGESPLLSSVRRHSMRDKHKLSVNEAKAEAEARYRISINTDDTSDEATSPRSSQMADSKSPVTNIDDIEMSVSGNNVTTIMITSPVLPAAPEDSHSNTYLHNVTLSAVQPSEGRSSEFINGNDKTHSNIVRVSSATIKINVDEDTVTYGKDTGSSNSSPQFEHTSLLSKNVEQLAKPLQVNGTAANVKHDSGDEPKHKFSALNDPPIGKDEHSTKNCCIIT